MIFSFGSSVFDCLVDKEVSNNVINLIYGPAASGKTTCCLLASIGVARKGGKIIFIDTENGFSVERLKQLCGQEYKRIINNIFVLKVKSFEDQKKKILELVSVVKEGMVDLIVIDTIGAHYRTVLKDDIKGVNNALIEQLKILKYITNLGVTILMTNQVYTNINGIGKIESVGGKMIKNFSTTLIELQNLSNNKRNAKLLKPEHKKKLFKIKKEGFILE